MAAATFLFHEGCGCCLFLVPCVSRKLTAGVRPQSKVFELAAATFFDYEGCGDYVGRNSVSSIGQNQSRLRFGDYLTIRMLWIYRELIKICSMSCCRGL